MNRHRYGVNYSTCNAGGFFHLLPTSYTEVVPGDTIGGEVECRVTSDTLNKPILNRAYQDQYAFYIPYRLLDSSWVDFISKESGSVPTVSNTFPANFERNLGIGGTANTAWLRYAYNMVWNNYFRHANTAEVALTNNALLACSPRPSTFAESIMDYADYADATVDSSQPTISVMQIREAFATQRWETLREFYGDTYTDYLAQVGVTAPWSIAEEPEPIGTCKDELKMIISKGTGSSTTALAQLAGVYQGTCKMPIKRTFCAEHGLVATFVVARIDTVNTAKAGPPVLVKDDHSKYWNPVDEIHEIQNWDANLWGTTTPTQMKTAKYEDYRKGDNLLGVLATNAYQATYTAVTPTDETYTSRTPTDYDSLFADKLTTTAGQHYQADTAVRLVKQSPVRPARAKYSEHM